MSNLEIIQDPEGIYAINGSEKKVTVDTKDTIEAKVVQKFVQEFNEVPEYWRRGVVARYLRSHSWLFNINEVVHERLWKITALDQKLVSSSVKLGLSNLVRKCIKKESVLDEYNRLNDELIAYVMKYLFKSSGKAPKK